MGENAFLMGVAKKYGIQQVDVTTLKAKFFDVYINTYAKAPGADIGAPGARMPVCS